jgi:hypothetical protein
VESELDVILLQQWAGDICCSMALGVASKRPDLDAPMVLFSLDVDMAGATAYQWWSQHYPHIKLWPALVCKSPGEALLNGIDLREWILIGLHGK